MKLINISVFLLLLILIGYTFHALMCSNVCYRKWTAISLVSLDLRFVTNNRNCILSIFPGIISQNVNKRSISLNSFPIEFKSASFQIIFDIFARNMNEKYLSFKENVAVCFACVGVVQCFSPFSVHLHLLCNTPQCVTNFVLL